MEPVKKQVTDYTTLWIVLIVFGGLGLGIFAIAVEVLKFMALWKWVFS